MTDAIGACIIDETRTLREAMRQTDRAATRCLIVVDGMRRVVGSVSDGDIRRGLLAGGSLAEPVAAVMNRHPRTVRADAPSAEEDARRLMDEHRIDVVPLVDAEGTLVDVRVRYPVAAPAPVTPRDTPVFLQAGGIGSRMEPFTRILPKPLIPLGDKPVIEVIMDRFAAAGFSRFVLSVRYKSEMIRAYFADESVRSKYTSVAFVEETFPMGTVGSLALARESLDRPFFLSNCDVLVDEPPAAILATHERGAYDLTVVGCRKRFAVPYGVLHEEGGVLRAIEEKPSFAYTVSTGVYVVSPSVLSYVSDDRRTDMDRLLGALMADGRRVGVHPIEEDRWHDVGEWEPYRNAVRRLEDAHGG